MVGIDLHSRIMEWTASVAAHFANAELLNTWT